MTVSTGDTRRDAPAVVDGEVVLDADEPRRSLVRLGFPAGVRVGRESLLVVAVVAPLLTVVYRLWDAHLRIPFSDRLDALGTSAYTKAIVEYGWYFTNPRLGAPFGADWRDFPVGGENLHWLSLKVLGVVTGDDALALNGYFLIGFFLVALSAYFVARYLRLGVPVSLVVGVLYAFLPYHAFRSEIQVARGVYYGVPPAMLVVLWAVDLRTGFLTTADGRTRWRRGRVATALAVAVLLGCSDTQNVAYFLTLLTVVALVGAARDRSWRPLALLALVGAVAAGTLAINNVPYLLAQRERGPNVVADRSLREQDEFGLRPVNLVLPVPGHRIGFLARLADDTVKAQATDSESGGTPLGIVGTVGLIASIGAVAAVALGGRRRDRWSDLLAQLGILNVVAILVGTIGGFSFLVALAGFRQYRSWNRISLFIAFASLLATGVLLERGCRWLRSRPVSTPAATTVVTAAVAVLLVGGTLDQIPPRYVPDYAAIATRYDQDATFYHDLERRLPRGAMVFDLPVAAFPEVGPIVNMPDYAQFAGYLHTDRLRFSYGGMKGRPQADWIHNLAECDPRLLVSQIAATGFDAAVVDTRGYTDGGASLLEAVRPLVGSPRERSADGHLLALDLAPLRARMLERVGGTTVRDWRAAVVDTAVEWTGFAAEEVACPTTRRLALEREPSLTITNSTAHRQRIRFTSRVEANALADRLTVHGPGFTEVIRLHDGRGRIDRTIDVAPGTHDVRFRAAGPRIRTGPDDPRTLYFALLDPTFGPSGTPSIVDWAHAATG